MMIRSCCASLAILMLMCLDAFAQTYAEQVISDGAIHYWRFEETATDQLAKDEIPDQPANGSVPAQTNNPGLYEGGVTLGVPSAFPGLGKASRFDGANGTHVALGTPQHPGDEITVEAWVNLDVDSSSSFAPVIARWDGSYELDVTAELNDFLQFPLRNDVNGFAGPNSDQTMSRGEWHHVVGVYADEMGTVYLDGVPGNSIALSGVLGDAGGDDGLWYLARTRGPDSGFAWDGVLDEIAIYPHGLSEEQINNHIAIAMRPVRPSGDFNGNEMLDTDDIDALSAEVRAGNNVPEFDVNSDNFVNDQERTVWVTVLKGTWFGDANLDGLFNSGDLVTVFSAGKYENGGNADWGEGDWNGDRMFGSGDMVLAFADGGYEAGERPMAAAVPEPTFACAVWLTMLWALTRRRL